MLLRPATSDDAETMASLYAIAFSTDQDTKIQKGDDIRDQVASWHVAEEAGSIVGMVRIAGKDIAYPGRTESSPSRTAPALSDQLLSDAPGLSSER